jgi:RNA polymerase sigma-70 factor (ECF subfamily)
LQEDDRRRFERVFVPHIAASYNLARWLLRDEHEAEDLVQEAYVRALKSFPTFHGADGRPWFLAIVRNCCFSRLRQKQARGKETRFDEELHGAADHAQNPESLVVDKEERQSLQEALDELPPEFKEAIILRELEGLSYKEIAAIADISMGTVMSRLARARALLRRRFENRLNEES